MAFVEMLRSARASRVAVLHEFWAQYSPAQKRIHAFFEGHEDIVFFAPFIEAHLPEGYRLVSHRCEGKPRVYEAFGAVVERIPDIRSVLFFVDKDIDDILGSPWPTDPRIFVTDVYSVENYVVTGEVLSALCRDCIRVSGVTFDYDALLQQFEKELARFYRSILIVMAWIVAVRRSGGRPNLKNIDLRDLYAISNECEVAVNVGDRLEALQRSTGIRHSREIYKHIGRTARDLKRLPPKRIVRGKFEAWFVVEFWKMTLRRLVELAREGGGRLDQKLQVEHSSFLMLAVRYIAIPKSLELFLKAHLVAPVVAHKTPSARRSWWEAATTAFKRLPFFN